MHRVAISTSVSAKRTAGKSAKAIEWLVYRLGGAKAAFLGHVTAPNEETALALAYDEFVITSPAERRRSLFSRWTAPNRLSLPLSLDDEARRLRYAGPLVDRR